MYWEPGSTCYGIKSLNNVTCVLNTFTLLVYALYSAFSVEYSPSKHGQILQLQDINYSFGDISKITGVSKTGAYNTVLCEQNHHTHNLLPHSGHPAAVTDRQCCQVLHEICKHRFGPYKAVAACIGDLTACQVCHIANQAGYHRWVAVCKPFLTEVVIKKHVKCAEENKVRDWSTVLWTDESSIELGEWPGCQFITRHPGEEYLLECIQSTFHSGQKTLMVWGAIGTGRKGPLIRLDMENGNNNGGKKQERGLNGAKYVAQVLQGPLKEFVEELEDKWDHNMLVVEDGAPGHTSKLTLKARSELGINKLTYPPKSPDLNPIEPL
jgi:hypothetical protein